MDKNEYDKLRTLEATPIAVIKGSDLSNQKNRVLLSGYTSERHDWKVILNNGCIYTYFTIPGDDSEELEITSNEDYVPRKRVYPHNSDYEFCRLLIERGVHITFGTFRGN